MAAEEALEGAVVSLNMDNGQAHLTLMRRQCCLVDRQGSERLALQGLSAGTSDSRSLKQMRVTPGTRTAYRTWLETCPPISLWIISVLRV